MKRLAATVVVLLAAGGGASAHRLDEYLQATRVSVSRDRLALEVDLTPGVNIASSVVETLDADGNDAISPAEAEAYGRAVLSDLVVTLDDDPVRMALARIEVPTIDEMRHGLGTIRVSAAGSVDAGIGRHRLHFLNNHRPDASVYMVNALVPEDGGVSLGASSRDPRQREFHIETTVRPQWLTQLLWLGLGAAVLAMAGTRVREKRITKKEKRIMTKDKRIMTNEARIGEDS